MHNDYETANAVREVEIEDMIKEYEAMCQRTNVVEREQGRASGDFIAALNEEVRMFRRIQAVRYGQREGKAVASRY